MVVQHNLQAMNANRMLNITTGSQSKSAEKLSSGYRINRAADDAAGLSISEKMRKQIRGLDQASTNAEDGVSAVQTAEGALTEVHSMLQRMNELAVQASNGTNSQTDRDAIQSEIDQLTTEIDRVAETTKFNETYLLKGDANGATKKMYLEAHDAGLKGKLTDNGDGTATFVMDELKAGDSVTIAGKSYTIGSTQTETEAVYDEKVTQAGDKLTVNGKEITIVDAYTTPGDADKVAAEKAAGKYTSADAHAMTITLLTDSNGKKMGKTAGNAVWLDPNKTSPYEFFQYWRNVDDADVMKCIKMLTFIPLDEIEKMESWEGSQLNEAKMILAYELTKLVHGEEEAKKAKAGALAIFGGSGDSSNMPTVEIEDADFKDGYVDIQTLLVKAGLCQSRGDARRNVEQGGVTANDEKATLDTKFTKADFGDGIVIRRGKKNFKKAVLK